MADYYVLNDDNTVRPVDDPTEWAIALEDRNRRRVAKDVFGDVWVSTVFLGLDHSFDDGPPLIFETMIFGGAHDQDQWRYSTWDEAVEGHKRAVAIAQTPSSDMGKGE